MKKLNLKWTVPVVISLIYCLMLWVIIPEVTDGWDWAAIPIIFTFLAIWLLIIIPVTAFLYARYAVKGTEDFKFILYHSLLIILPIVIDTICRGILKLQKMPGFESGSFRPLLDYLCYIVDGLLPCFAVFGWYTLWGWLGYRRALK